MDRGISLFRSKVRGRAVGNFKARWRGAGGARVTWNTKTLDAHEALRRAAEELGRRNHAHASSTPRNEARPSAGLPAGATTTTTTTTNGFHPPPRRPLAEALTRALSSNGAPAAPPAAAAEPDQGDEKQIKARRLYEVFGRCMGYLTEGALKRAVRFAGREPEEMDDDEVTLLREGWQEKGEEWFGGTELGPWGKIALGSTVAGVGMYMGGKPIPKPNPLPPKAPEEKGGDGES